MGIERMRHAALTAVAAVVASVAVVGAASAEMSRGAVDAETESHTRRIATSRLGHDLTVRLTAVRSTSDRLAASVRLSTYRFADGEWVLEDRARVGDRDSWFWFPLTGSHAVCRFSTSSARREPIRVQLLVTPSLGCSDVIRFHIDDGEIVSD